MKVEMGKKYKTMSGHEVILYTTEALGDFPVKGSIRKNGVDYMQGWTIDGKYVDCDTVSPYDLVEVREPLELTAWVDDLDGGRVCAVDSCFRGMAVPAHCRRVKLREVIED